MSTAVNLQFCKTILKLSGSFTIHIYYLLNNNNVSFKLPSVLNCSLMIEQTTETLVINSGWHLPFNHSGAIIVIFVFHCSVDDYLTIYFLLQVEIFTFIFFYLYFFINCCCIKSDNQHSHENCPAKLSTQNTAAAQQLIIKVVPETSLLLKKVASLHSTQPLSPHRTAVL